MSREGLTARDFAVRIGVQPSSISHISSGRNKPSVDFLEKLLQTFPQYDANWLLLGVGEPEKVTEKAQLDPNSDEEPAFAPMAQEVVKEDAGGKGAKDASAAAPKQGVTWKIVQHSLFHDDGNYAQPQLAVERESQTASTADMSKSAGEEIYPGLSDVADLQPSTSCPSFADAGVARSETKVLPNANVKDVNPARKCNGEDRTASSPRRVMLFFDDGTFEQFVQRE